MLETLVADYGTDLMLALAGMLVGLLFGIGAQHSRFCLRAAVSEIAERRPGQRFGVWLVVFFTAMIVTQTAIWFEYLDVTESRQLASAGSISGAMIGGLLFGIGMILARGCASRLLVLSGTGNLRALVTGLWLTLVAQASLRGILTPAREEISGLWVIEGGDSRDLLSWLNSSATPFLILSLTALVGSLIYLKKTNFRGTRSAAAVLVGLCVAMGWFLTYQISQNSFDVVDLSSVTFTGPATDTLMVLVNETGFPLKLGVGLVIGVFAGSMLAAYFSGELIVQRFGPDVPMERYLLGATFMGFGAMLAGGCAVGAGVTGTAVFSLTAWVAIIFMWIGAFATELLLSHRLSARPVSDFSHGGETAR